MELTPTPKRTRRQFTGMPGPERIYTARAFGHWPVEVTHGRHKDYRETIHCTIVAAGRILNSTSGEGIVISPLDDPEDVIIIPAATIIHIRHLTSEE
jgi:hypothetical protein